MLAGPLSALDRTALGREAAIARAQRAAIVNRGGDLRRTQWAAWLRRAFDNGAGAAHSFVRRADRDHANVDRVGLIRQLSNLHGQWKGHWRAATGPLTLAAAGVEPALWARREFGWSAFAESVDVTSEAVYHASRLFKPGTAVAFDGLHCRHLALLPQDLLGVAATLMRVALSTGYLAGAAAVISVPLVPKPDGIALRPVGVFSALHRVLGAVVKGRSRAWEVALTRASPIFCAGQARSATDVVWRQAASAQVAAARGPGAATAAAALLLDVEKFFDTLDFGVLALAARRLQFPLDLLRLALTSYRWPRVVRNRGWVTPPLSAKRG